MKSMKVDRMKGGRDGNEGRKEGRKSMKVSRK